MTRRASIRRLSLCSKDGDTKMGQKSDDSSKFEHSNGKVEVFLPQNDHGGSSDIGGLARKIRLG